MLEAGGEVKRRRLPRPDETESREGLALPDRELEAPTATRQQLYRADANRTSAASAGAGESCLPARSSAIAGLLVQEEPRDREGKLRRPQGPVLGSCRPAAAPPPPEPAAGVRSDPAGGTPQ